MTLEYVRLNKLLADNNIGSRRKCDEIIQSIGVEINGEKIFDPSYRVSKQDTVIFKGKKIDFKPSIKIIAFNKPPFYLTSTVSQGGKKTIYDILPKEFKNFKYVGRLDYETRGLLLLTNRGDIVDFLSRPENKIEKTYIAVVNRELTQEQLKKFSQGIFIDNYLTKPAKIKRIGTRTYTVKIIEGKKRQIRLMFKSLGARVVDLKRIQIGSISLQELNIKEGEYKELSQKEINNLIVNKKLKF